MQLYKRTNRRWHLAAQTSSLLASSIFVAVIAAVLVAASFKAEPVSTNEHVQLVPGELRANVETDPDLETLTVLVITQGERVHFRIGSQTAGSSVELKERLEPLARLGGSISVRISHDGPFFHTATAIAACRDAGFRTVFLVPGGPAR
jgi:hypothetical protein